MNVVCIFEGVDDVEVCGCLLNDFNLEIGVGLGVFVGKVWWIGLMGVVCIDKNVDFCLVVLKMVLK